MLREVIDDPTVEIVSNPPRERPPSSRIDTEAFRALEAVQKRLYPDATTLPAMLTGGTDMKPLRSKGVQAYGIGPFTAEEDQGKYSAHADDEQDGCHVDHQGRKPSVVSEDLSREQCEQNRRRDIADAPCKIERCPESLDRNGRRNGVE